MTFNQASDSRRPTLMDKPQFDDADYSAVVKNRATPSELVEVGDLSCR